MVFTTVKTKIQKWKICQEQKIGLTSDVSLGLYGGWVGV